MDQDQTRYDRKYFSNIFHYEVPDSQRNQNRLKLTRSLKDSGRLLEMGCGTGHFLRMATRYYQADGADISAHAIESLRGLKTENLWRMDVEADQLPVGVYDLIVAFNLFEHLRNPEDVIARVFRALKPDGCLIGSVPYNAAFLGRIHTGLTNLFDTTHVSTFSPDRWRDIFHSAGFTKVMFFGELLFTKSRNIYVRHRYWRWFTFNLMFQCSR